jgi:hypothetical protein
VTTTTTAAGAPPTTTNGDRDGSGVTPTQTTVATAAPPTTTRATGGHHNGKGGSRGSTTTTVAGVGQHDHNRSEGDSGGCTMATSTTLTPTFFNSFVSFRLSLIIINIIVTLFCILQLNIIIFYP